MKSLILNKIFPSLFFKLNKSLSASRKIHLWKILVNLHLLALTCRRLTCKSLNKPLAAASMAFESWSVRILTSNLGCLWAHPRQTFGTFNSQSRHFARFDLTLSPRTLDKLLFMQQSLWAQWNHLAFYHFKPFEFISFLSFHVLTTAVIWDRVFLNCRNMK